MYDIWFVIGVVYVFSMGLIRAFDLLEEKEEVGFKIFCTVVMVILYAIPFILGLLSNYNIGG